MAAENKTSKLAQEYSRTAYNTLQGARKHLESVHYAEAVMQATDSIEYSLKAIYLSLLGREPPRMHFLSEKDFQKELTDLSSHMPPDLHYVELHRVVFLNNLWGGVRNLVRYGSQALGAGPESMIKQEEAKLIVDHAWQCYSACSSIIDFRPRSS